MTIIGQGRLKHHFWGDYSATIGLQFGTADYAARALPFLPGFSVHPNVPEALVFHGGGQALKAAEALLAHFKADMKKVGSVRYSIDYGEPFTIEVDITPDPTEVQLALFEGVQ